MTALRTPQERVDWAASQVGTTYYNGKCEAFTRSCFPFEAMYGTAHDAYVDSANHGAVHVDYDAPVGVPVFFDITYGSNAPYDHIALSSGGGKCYSDNAGPGGTLVEVGIAELTQRWGMTYRGWGEVYHRTRVYEPDTDHDDQEDEMKYSGWDRSEDQALPNGEWHSLYIDDEGNMSLSWDTKPYQALVFLQVTGQKPGDTLQVRFKEVDTKSGEANKVHRHLSAVEIPCTDGTTYGQVVQFGNMGDPASGWSRKLRLEAKTYRDGVKVVGMQSRIFQ